MARVLLVDDEPSIRETLSEFLREDGHDVVVADCVPEATRQLAQTEFDVVVSDIILPQASGLELLAELSRGSSRVKVILITGEPSFATAAEALRHGAHDYLPKPVRRQAISRTVAAAAREKALEDENLRYRERLEILVTERTRQIRDYSDRLRELLDGSLMGVALVQDGALVYANPRLAEILGEPRSAAAALVGRRLLDLVHPDSLDAAVARFSGRSRDEAAARALLRLARQDEEEAWVEAVANPVQHEGRPALLVNVVDATSRRRAEVERERLEAQFLQSQKMEVVGRLAGSVAHDFNNILMAIFSYSDLLLAELGEGHPCAGDVHEVQLAAERAAALTRQLLAFSRHQVRDPKVLDLNAVVASAEKMLGRLVGEDVSLRFLQAAGLPPVLIDPIHVDQILLNLVTNARDAMPRGGTLTIATGLREDAAGASVGEWVTVGVFDSGCGMDEKTRARAFEPFFTTKARGTGLGLATVRSIAEQSGGRVEVESAPGQGTRVTVLLPAVSPAVPSDGDPAAAAGIPRGSETVLLVEDDATVRRLTAGMLASLGYAVIEAQSGEEAARLAAEGTEPIHLLLSDVVLPGRSGPEALTAVRERRPRIRQLFMSGYAEDVIGQHGVLAPGVRLLRKPFSAAALARAVREALEG